MALTLDDLLIDGRLTRLFSKDARNCALQLWILQIKSGQSIENRIVYGRLLPYSHATERWSSTDDDNFHAFGEVQAQVIRLNLYVKSNCCAELLRQLISGRTISEVSEELQFGVSRQLNERFGATALTADELIYRPVAYLLNRDAHVSGLCSSPHGGAGAFSASITQADKRALFRLGRDYDADLVASVVKSINSDTGLDFGGADTSRFGDIELLVFPTLDDFERRLLSVDWVDSSLAFVARFNPMQVPHYCGFQFHLKIENDGHVIYSYVTTAERNEEGEFECRFELSDQLRASSDTTELEIFGFHSDYSSGGMLCCRWRIGYIREVSLQSHLVGHGANPVKFDWLEKTTRPLVLPRVKAALTISRGNPGFTSRIGGRESDPWVPINRDLTSLFARLHPSKSDGCFFQRWGQGDGDGRLQLVEWFRVLLAKYQQHQLVIFDPYFEDAGLGLMLLCAAPNVEYIVFTSLLKPSKKSEESPDETDKSTPDRINNLLASCEHNRQLLQRIKLRIYGLKEGRLHDRYILIMGADRLPIAGFHLSNSFQKAAENYPLLITPIPADVLLKVEHYKFGLVQEAMVLQPEGEAGNSPMRLLFDSAVPATVAPQRYEPLRFLEKAQAGDVLSSWIGESSLQGLSGDPLKEQMTTLGMLTGSSLTLPESAGFRNYLDHQIGDFTKFMADWEVLGDVLAHSSTKEHYSRELESERGFLELLLRFLKISFSRTHHERAKELSMMDAQFFRMSLEALLQSSYRPHHLFQTTKYAALTWAEYFAVKFLWWYAPDALVSTVEAQMPTVPVEPQNSEAVRLSLLSQVVSEISLSMQFNISETQRERLLRSGNGLLQWIGLNATERQLEKPDGITAVLQSVAAFPYIQQIQALGWMIHRAAANPATAEVYNGLVTALHGTLPTSVPAGEVRHLVDSLRGHMRRLAWAEPWLSQDVIFPLLQTHRVNTDDACEIWVQELAASLGTETTHRLFDREREGQMTSITAFLFAHSSPEQQSASLRVLKAIVKRQQRILQRPLASTSSWTQWNDALVISMWILTFTRWSQFYLRESAITCSELEDLSRNVQQLAVIRPMGEWRSEGAGSQGELAAFLDQVEELLASSDE